MRKTGRNCRLPRDAPMGWRATSKGCCAMQGGRFSLTASQRKQRESRGRKTSPTRRYRMTYVVKGIDPAPYRPLFGLPDEELARRNIVRMTVTKKLSFPCRVSLTDRDIGESVLLLNHFSHDVANPYRASHAIFITEGADQAAQYVDEVPPVFQ